MSNITTNTLNTLANSNKLANKQTKPNNHTNRYGGFTIIELLIVIVIIGILVAITSIAYTGLTKQAKDASAKSDLKQASTQLEIDKAKSPNSTYPTSTSSLKTSKGNTFELTTSSGNTEYCLSVTSNPSTAFHITNSNTNPQPGVCSGHQEPTGNTGGGGGDIANNTPMQNISKSQCNALPIYNGTNTNAIRTVTDTRGGTTRTYEIARLADNNCWMLTNLKLGSTTSTINLTNTDTDLNTKSSFTLPKLYSGTSSSYQSNDTPYTFGPVPGDTSSGQTNYGYLYNFSAATAGETTTSLPAGNNVAQNSICPKGWRLPKGGVDTSDWEIPLPNNDFANLDKAFGGTGKYTESGPSIAKWQPSGPFKGVFSGYWNGGFDYQSEGGGLWSASASPDYPDNAFTAGFDPAYVHPGVYYDYRFLGLGVRCLLN